MNVAECRAWERRELRQAFLALVVRLNAVAPQAGAVVATSELAGIEFETRKPATRRQAGERAQPRYGG